MCGISGFVGPIYRKEELQKYITDACLKLRHRGPDDLQVFVEDHIALGATRLAIRDPQHGMQPFSYSGTTIVFNGELYNTAPLKKKLERAGYLFQTDCDTEILLKAYIAFGEDILKDLEGMFAFGIWDEKKQVLTLARDRWGEKPLYYALDNQSLTFGSEIKALQCFPHISWVISEEDAMHFLKNSYLSHPRTGWRDIHKLEQGSVLHFHQGNQTIRRFFTPTVEEFSKQPTSEELFDLLKSNVKHCLISDKPVGGFLSGGLDSTTVAFFLSREKPDVPFFSLHWDDDHYSEEMFTMEAAKALKLNHHSIKCDHKFFRDHFDFIVDLYDEPFGDESMVPTFCLAKFAKSQVDVVLTGDGADELFHGYERYFYEGNLKDYLDVFAATPSPVMELVCHHDLLRDFSLLSSALKATDTERVRSWIDMKTYLPNDILTKVDRATMGVGLEARCPFLTPRMTHFALGCSLETLIGTQRRGKEILRKAMKNHLPELIIERKKMGFGVPLNDWFRTVLKDWMIVRLLEGSLLQSNWFSASGIKKLIALHEAKQGNYARPLLNLLVLERWLHNYFTHTSRLISCAWKMS